MKGNRTEPELVWARDIQVRFNRGLFLLLLVTFLGTIGAGLAIPFAASLAALLGAELRSPIVAGVGILVSIAVPLLAFVGAMVASFMRMPRFADVDRAKAIVDRDNERVAARALPLAPAAPPTPDESPVATLFEALRGHLHEPHALTAIDDAERRWAALRADVARLEDAMRTEAALGGAPAERLARLTEERDARKAHLEELLDQLRALHTELVLSGPAPEPPALIARLTETLAAENEVERAIAARARGRTTA